jgi:hypothetical protein
MTLEAMKVPDFQENKEEELTDLAYDDQADKALEEGLKIGAVRVVNLASRIVLCSGSYSEESRLLAAKNNFDPDLEEIRRKILAPKS